MAIAIKPPRWQRPRAQEWREWVEGYLFASPFIIGFLVFVAYPMAYSLWLAFQRWDGIPLTPARFIGLANFQKALTNENAVLSLYNTAYYTFLAVPFQLIISFVLALALTQNMRFRDLYRAGFYMPIIVPAVASAMVWQRVFHQDFGILNEALGWFGIPAQKWLFDPSLAKPAFIFMSFWMIGRQMVIFIAGLGNIPQTLLEAASLDGANAWQKLRHVTIPMMTPLIFYNMVIAIVNSFQIFIPAKIMTDGGPQNATLFMVLNIYRQGFQSFDLGYAAALAWELFVIVIGFTIAQFYLSNRWVYYEVEK
ncbi:MAG: sugar ABC transporter permease [Anaerolineae bacterium]|nr:sugar ABC transporter permease [Anaerolineae bacterium]